MKLFNIDWQDFIQRLGVWQRLSLAARQTLAAVHANESAPVAALDGHGRQLAEADFIEIHSAGQRVRLARTCYPFARVLRAMMRHDLFTDPRDDVLPSYLHDHFTQQELYALCGDLYYGYGIEHTLASEARSVHWVETFLAEPVKKQVGRLDRNLMPAWLKVFHETREAAADPNVAKRLVRHLMELPGPVPFAELPGRWADVPTPSLGAAIGQGVERLVLFPTMRRKDMTPMLGLWPTIHHRLHRPKPKPPEPVKPQAVFHGAFLMEDMTTALVAAMAQPLRLRGNDAALFARAERDLEGNLMSAPEWVFAALRRPVKGRIAVTLDWLQTLRLAKRVGVPGEDLRLQATGKGEAWLAETAKGRLRVVLDHFRAPGKNKTRLPTRTCPVASDDGEDDEVMFDEEAYDEETYDDYPRSLDFLPFAVRMSGSHHHNMELRAAVVSAVTTLPVETFVPLAGFLDWQSREANPLPKLFGGQSLPSLHLNWSHRPATIEEMEELWSGFLMEMLRERLVPLGCVRLGTIDESGGVCLALSGAGRYLLGLAEDFDYGHDQDAQGQLLVQPNFDVVFLSPSPLAEAALARFAQRKGRGGVGSLFAITKKSIVSAAGSGMTASQVLDSLKRLSAKPIPANVAREIVGWFDQCRHITVRSAVLIHCPDADTAARVVAASGKQAVALTDTVVELADALAKNELLRKLHGMGIFTQSQTTFSPRRHERSRATRGRRMRS